MIGGVGRYILQGTRPIARTVRSVESPISYVSKSAGKIVDNLASSIERLSPSERNDTTEVVEHVSENIEQSEIVQERKAAEEAVRRDEIAFLKAKVHALEEENAVLRSGTVSREDFKKARAYERMQWEASQLEERLRDQEEEEFEREVYVTP